MQVPDLPAPPEYYTVRFEPVDGFYCLDPENAGNLLKNRELDKGYQEELRTILMNLKGL